MSVLTDAQRSTLEQLVDAIHPAVDDIPSGTQLGAARALESALVDADWNGARYFPDPPHEPVPHRGHGWQGDGVPAQLLARVLDQLAAPVALAGADAVLKQAVAGEITLGVIASFDFVRLLQRHVAAHVTSAKVR